MVMMKEEFTVQMIVFQVPKTGLCLNALLLVSDAVVTSPHSLDQTVADAGAVQNKADHHQHWTGYSRSLYNVSQRIIFFPTESSFKMNRLCYCCKSTVNYLFFSLFEDFLY